MRFGSGKPLITIVAPITKHHDAISDSVRNTYKGLSRSSDWDVTVVTGYNEFADIPARVVGGVADLLVDRAFRSADAILYHFGIYNPFFDALPIGNGHAKQIVRFHNITPPEFVTEEARPLIERSFRQLHNLRHADRIWADSQLNANVLVEHEIDPRKIEVIPLSVEWPELKHLGEKIGKPLQLLFVGRAVQSKGLLDCIEAASTLKQSGTPFTLSVAGNLDFADPVYLERCKHRVQELGLDTSVRFLGTVDAAALASAFERAHVLVMPSYHEGFCVPIVEGFRSGCVPIGYAAGNLPYITSNLGRLVPPGDISALGSALCQIAAELGQSRQDPVGQCITLDRGPTRVEEFDDESKRFVRNFSAQKVHDMQTRRMKRLVFGNGRARSDSTTMNIRPEISVLPDVEMRERDRSSLNRLPDLSDWEVGGALTDLMRDMYQPVGIHRKSWEYALAIKGLTELGVVGPDSVGLAVGAGSETPLFYFANHIKRMVATDLYDNPDHEGTPAMLANPHAFAPFPYREEHLEVLRMSGDNLEFPDGSFDFVFTLSSIEHFGSREIQHRSVAEMARVLRPGGIACIITELILTDGNDKEYFTLEEVDGMFLRHPQLELVGGDLDLSISESLVDYPVDLLETKHLNRSPHIVLKRGPLKWTSLSMFLRRKTR
jgi:glycosyltransferase involved in cell wall biosynthesis/SAM-dependent methyltransferase